MYNKKDIPGLMTKIAISIANAGTDEAPGIEKMIARITGPNTGLIYKPGSRGTPGNLELAEGWIFDSNGNIVRLEDATGPATGEIYKDKKLVDAQ